MEARLAPFFLLVLRGDCDEICAHVIQLWHADSHGGHLRECDPDTCEFRSRLSKDEYRGIWGLYYSLVCLLEGPHVKPIIGHPTGRSRNMVEVRPLSLVSKSWVEKLQRLFDWDDGVTRRWDSADFRLITRESYAILRDCASENEAVAWRRAIGSRASEYITIIPRYERDKLRILEKASPNNSKQVQQARRLGTRQYIWIGAFLPNPQEDLYNQRRERRKWQLCCSQQEERLVRRKRKQPFLLQRHGPG